jgi:hypothetical protein
VVSRKVIFLFAAIYCTLVPRDGFIVTLHRTLVYSLGGIGHVAYAAEIRRSTINDFGCRDLLDAGDAKCFGQAV